MTEERRVLVCVGGGIAAYKSVVLVRELARRGASVRVAMTEAATRFVGPITFTGITGKPPVLDMWDPSYPGEVHVELASWAELVVVAPATADLMAKLASGLAGDVVLATLLCRRGPVLLAPAMHSRMWEAPATRANVERLRGSAGVAWIGPVEGALASGETGIGRMAEPEDVAARAFELLDARADLAGVSVLVTAGPTYEDVDPVRFLGNRSSGKMGFAVAERARARGARVALVAGPTSAPAPVVDELVRVRSALEMQRAVESRIPTSDVVVMAAAVADYRPATRHEHKMKKGDDEELSLPLVKNPDILAGLGRARGSEKRPVLVGFAVESSDVVTYARDKLARKGVDLVVANRADVGFENDDNEVVFVDASGDEPFGPAPKLAVADALLDRAKRLLV